MIIYDIKENNILEIEFIEKKESIDHVKIYTDTGWIKTDGQESTYAFTNHILNGIDSGEIIILEDENETY